MRCVMAVSFLSLLALAPADFRDNLRSFDLPIPTLAPEQRPLNGPWRSPETHRYFNIGAGGIWSVEILGSADSRRGGHFYAQYAKPEPKWTWRDFPAQLVVEGYYTYHKGGNVDLAPIETLHASGLLVMARYWNTNPRFPNTFFEFGWGLHFGDRLTPDLDWPVSSTPTFGIGLLTHTGDTHLIWTLRLMHVSNAGLGRINRGQNGLIFMVGYAF